MNLQISEAVKPKGDRDSVTFIFLAQWRATTFDPKIRQRIGWSWWWDKQRWLSDDQWTKKGGGGGNAGPGYLKKNEHFFQKYGAELKQVE